MRLRIWWTGSAPATYMKRMIPISNLRIWGGPMSVLDILISEEALYKCMVLHDIELNQ